jgi:hypothetical protein
MRPSTSRSGAIGLLLIVTAASTGPARAWCIWGFGQCEISNPLVGEYMLDGTSVAALSITRDKITSKMGLVSFTVDYAIKAVDGKKVMIEVGTPQGKETLQVDVGKDMITVRHERFFAGAWRKTAASR